MTARTKRRLLAVPQATMRYVRLHPFSTVIAAVILVAAIVTGVNGPDLRVQRLVGTNFAALSAGRWWTPITSTFFTNNVAELIAVLLCALVLLAWAERIMGWRRTAVAFFLTSLIGPLAGVALEAVARNGGEFWARSVAGLISLDPLTGIAGALMTASAFASHLWRRRIRVLTVLVCLVLMLYSGQPSDLYRLIGVLIGLWLGRLLAPPASFSGWARSSDHETRVLLASAVAVSAVGPAIALLSPARFGPLAPIGMLFTNQVPQASDVIARCQVFAITEKCMHDLTLERIDGIGPVLLSVLPLLVLLIAAYGLLRGSRFAVWLAISVNLLLATLTALYFGLIPVTGGTHVAHTGPRHWEFLLVLLLSVLLPLAIAIALFVSRRHFPVLAPERLIREFLLIVVISGVFLAVLYISVGFGLRESAFTRPLDSGDLLADVVQRFIPVNFLSREAASFFPTTLPGRLLYHGVGPLFWLIVVAAAIKPLRYSRVRGGDSDATLARWLLMQGGGDSLGYMTTWNGNSYWFDPDSTAAVAYRVIGRVAITTGGPIGTTDPTRECLERFGRFCDDNGWIPVFYSVEASLSRSFSDMGWETIVVAEESVIDPQEWTTVGKKWQDVRTSINKAQKAGIRAEWTSYPDLTLATQSQIATISEEWVAEKELPEMGFTLGGLDELQDPNVRLMLAVDSEDRIQAVTSWLPKYAGGVVVGWTLDFMRRRAGSMNGVMEFLIAAAAVRMRDEGITHLSLSGAPLAHSAGADDGVSGRESILDYLSASLEPVYGFQSLLRFKSKFQPQFRPLLMAYPDPAALPLIGVALARAYAPGLSVGQAASLVRTRG